MCNQLLKLIELPTAKSLVQLAKLEVGLTSFYSRNCSIEFPSLQHVFVVQCPNMKIFSHGVLIMPKLDRVKTGEFKFEIEDEMEDESEYETEDEIHDETEDGIGFETEDELSEEENSSDSLEL
ncbi:hypothetical protein EZV62_009379 [Acer yangbiense]|uniref:Uncharacterized protein n=1 Tax=Acer yangbiense TaxID=1000413 RepID=A0A5C7IGI6_9ROSI|nr:hypothetical protein EZV62_009379 [Acer yangbiense]